jgi:hypothetical protein
MSGEPADQPEEERNKRRRTSSPDGRNDLVPFKLAMDQVATTLSSVFASDLRELRENTDKKILEQRRIVEEEADVKYKKLEADSQELVRSKVVIYFSLGMHDWLNNQLSPRMLNWTRRLPRW